MPYEGTQCACIDPELQIKTVYGLCVQPGAYSYQYLVDGTWMTSPDAPVGPDDDGHLCNKVRPPTLPELMSHPPFDDLLVCRDQAMLGTCTDGALSCMQLTVACRCMAR